VSSNTVNVRGHGTSLNRSAVGTLVERDTRYVMLLHLPDGHNAGQVRDGLITLFSRLPDALARTLTRD
jgi:IS30 family transposase